MNAQVTPCVTDVTTGDKAAGTKVRSLSGPLVTCVSANADGNAAQILELIRCLAGKHGFQLEFAIGEQKGLFLRDIPATENDRRRNTFSLYYHRYANGPDALLVMKIGQNLPQSRFENVASQIFHMIERGEKWIDKTGKVHETAHGEPQDKQARIERRKRKMERSAENRRKGFYPRLLRGYGFGGRV